MTATAPNWLRGAYSAALALHAVFVAAMLWLNLAAPGNLGTVANAARETGALSLLLFLTGMAVTLPSIAALASWWLCRRRGWVPSPGHMGLSVAAAALVTGFVIVAVSS